MKSIRIAAMLLIPILLGGLCHGQGFSNVLGTAAVTLDPAKVAEVSAGAPGTRYWYDTNSDGKIDEVWFIDIDPRHSPARRPMLVKCIDKDGDLARGIEPDRDSDVYIADWNANGTADSAVIYEDRDGDDDMDTMAYYYTANGTWWWSRDDCDDNLLYWDRDYTLSQTPCQDFSHLGGDETFISMYFDSAAKKWIPRWEAPFFFYDNTGDGRTDEVVRVTVPSTAAPQTVLTLRWSFNVNADGTDEDPRNYDCSLSAYPVTGTTIGGANVVSDSHYGYPLTPLLSRDTARPWLRSTKWRSGLFTWVENDNNVGWQDTYTAERWEGVICHGSTNFTQIGSPSCGPYNNRNEIDLNPAGPFEFYFSPADHRIHIKSADEAWVLADWDGNFSPDMRYNWIDSNADGLLDRITLDTDNNGTIDDQWDIATNAIQTIAYDWQVFRDAYAPVLSDYPAQLYELDRTLAVALDAVQPGSSYDPVWSLIENKFANASIPEWKREKFLNSDIALIYYLELVRDRRIAKLKPLTSSFAHFWAAFNSFRTAGATDSMTWQIRQTWALGSPTWTPFATWIANLRADNTKRVNSSIAWLPNGIAWETEQAAWRIRNGQFDFLGKREKRLVLDGITASTDLSTDNGGWGMDALNEGTGPGAGGLTLYVNGEAYPLYGPSVSATYRVVEQTNDRVTVEMMVSNAGPAGLPRTVQVCATAQAGRAETQFTALVQGGPRDDRIELGVGLTRPAETYFENNPTSGILGVWGFQTPQIDWVGLGMIYPPGIYSRLIQAPSELGIVLKAYPGRLIDWTIKNDWRRGRRFSNFPVLVNWMREMNKAASTITFPTRSVADREWILIE